MCYPMGSYRAFLWCVSTPSGCKCLFIVYAFYLWEASCYESFLVSHNVVIYCMLDLVDPYGRYYVLPFRSSTSHSSHHSSWTGALLPFLLGYFFIAGRFCINDIAQQCHIIALCLRPLLSLKVSSYYSLSWIELLSLVPQNKSHPSFLVGDCMWSFL